MLIVLCCAILTPFLASADDGPTCVHVDGVEVSINSEQTEVHFYNRTSNAITINWEVWSNDPNYNPKKIASGTTYVPPFAKGRTTNSDEYTPGYAREYITVPDGWSGAWLKHCKN